MPFFTVVPVFTIAVPVAPIALTIPSMVVAVVAARRVPVPFVKPAGFPVRLYPIRPLVRRARPVAVVPDPTASDGIPIAFDPFVAGARIGRDPVIARRRRRRAD